MRIVRQSEWRISAWKNGLGRTAEIAIHPSEAQFSNFDWRISVANVGGSGPFSEFPGIDRVMAVLSGDGVSLQLGNSLPVRVTPQTDPISFPGDVPAAATLLGSAVSDLNLMVRRRAGTMPSIRKLALRDHARLEADSRLLAVYFHSGSAAVGDTARLEAGNTLLVPDGVAAPIELAGDASLFVLSL